MIHFQAVLFRSLSVLDPVRVGDIVAVSSPPLPIEACALSPYSSANSSEPPLGIRRVAAVAGDELIASDDGEVMVVPPGCVWLTCDNSSGEVASRIDSRVVGPVSLYDVLGRALSIVAAGTRPAALSSNAETISEDLKWARLARLVFIFARDFALTILSALFKQSRSAVAVNRDTPF